MIEFETRRRPEGAPRSLRGGYDELYRSEPIRHLDSFYRWALRIARPAPGSRLLDVSCGVGRLVDLATARGVRAVGLDVSTAALEHGKRHGMRGKFVAGDAEQLPFATDSFDRVVNLGSLEHYGAPARGVAEMARVLRPGGDAVILVPNTFAILHVIYAWRHGRVYDDGQPLQRYGTYWDWRALIEGHGLRVTRTTKYQRPAPATAADLLWYVRRPGKLLQMLLTPLLPLHAASCFVFTCQKSGRDAPPAARPLISTFPQPREGTFGQKSY